LKFDAERAPAAPSSPTPTVGKNSKYAFFDAGGSKGHFTLHGRQEQPNRRMAAAGVSVAQLQAHQGDFHFF
jgi:hypothetical protein